VVPTFNERENIVPFLEALRAAAPDADVLVVDDNSPDGTGNAAEQTASELGQIKVLHRPGKQGLGSAYRHGFTVALDEGYEAVVTMDVDFSRSSARATSTAAALRTGRCTGGSSRVGETGTPRSCSGCACGTARRGFARTARSRSARWTTTRPPPRGTRS
jgi:GT2 family glycosyltransferase